MSTNIKLKRSSVKGKSPTTSNLELGEIAINTNDGRLFFKTTDSASTSAIQTLREITAGTGITVSQGQVSITNSGVSSGSYGSSTQIPIFSVNAQGQIDSASTVSVAGVSGLGYDSDTNLLTLSTADGGSYSVKINLDTFNDSDTTDDLNEGSTNLYYTDARVQTHLGAVTGSIIPDTDSAYDLGSPTNKFRDLYLSNNTLYLGNARLSYDSDNAQIVVNNNVDSTITLNYDLSNNTTDDLPQGQANLYYDSDRTIRTALDAIRVSGDALSYNASNGTITYSEVAYQGFDSDFNAKSTTNLSEGSNLYFTDARARSAVSATDNGGDGSFSYDSVTGVFSYTGPSASEVRTHFSAGTGIGITNGQISTSITQYTDADARGTVSVNDVSGDGSLSYDSSTGIFTYTGPSATEVRSHFSAGGDLAYDSSTGRYSFTERTDQEVRNLFSGTGDISYNSSTGEFSLDVEEVYTKDNFDSDFDIRLSEKTTDNLTQGSTNLYYDSATTQTNARNAISVTDAGGDGSLSYDNDTGAITYTGPSASETRAHFSAGGDLAYDSSTGRYSFTERTDQEVRNLFSGTGDISYNSSTGEFSLDVEEVYTKDNFDSDFDIRLSEKTTDNLTQGSTNLYYDSATTQTNARNAISVTDAGGDGSLSYDNDTGAITYTGPSASETRAHFSGGTGVTITDGSVAIAQSVGTADDVQFGKVTVDSAQIDCLHLSKLPEAPNSLRGLLYYDSDPQKGLSFIPTTNELVEDVTVNIGQETLIYVHNLTGAQIDNGQAVYISGVAHGAHPQVTLAKADNADTARPIGLATMNIPNGAHGYVTKTGLVRDVNTAGMVAGGTAYLSKDSAGQWSTSEVSVDSGYPTHLGTVLVTDSASGTILVNVEAEHFEYLRVQDKIITHDLEAPDIYGSHIHLDGKAPSYYQEGLVFYDSANGALVVKNDEEEITLQVGQEEWLRIYNNSGSTITNGTPVHISGENSGMPTVAPANATVEEESYVAGIATHDIENGTTGYITVRGIVNDIDTSGITAGQRVHIAADGSLQNAAPEFPYYPCDIGYCLTSDASTGQLYVDIKDHTFETIRVTNNARFDADVTIAGNLNVIGVTTEVLSQSLTTSGNLLQLLDGDTVGTAYQNVGGLNDATFRGKYTGDSDVYYFVRMFSVDSAAIGDVIEWGISDSDTIHPSGYGIGFDSAGGQTTWNLKNDGLTAPLRSGLSIQFINLSGHDSADVWCAHPTELNLDLGMIGNYNQQNEPLKYAGVVRDATDERWKFFDGYPAANVDSSSAQFDINFDSASLADIEFSTAYGNLSGNATTATTATQLANSRNFSLSGDITSAAVGFNGTGNVTLTTSIGAGVIVNADINASAAIADTKLANISTAGKVLNSATTATSSNTASAIVARDVTGNFSAGTITANLTGNVTGTVSDISNHNSTIRNLFSVDNSGLGYDSATGQFSLTNPGTDSAETHSIFSVDSSANTGDGSLTYNNAGVFTYVGPSASETRAHFSEGTGITITNGQIATTITQYADADAQSAISLNATNGLSSLSYDSSTGAFTFVSVDSADVRTVFSSGTGIGISGTGEISTSITQYTDALARGAISHSNTGTGFGSIGYNSSTGVINYNKVTRSDIRGSLSVSGDLSYDSSLGQFSFDETYSTPSELLTAVKTVDGSGSGLDADTLDGQQGSHYRINVYNSSGTLLN